MIPLRPLLAFAAALLLAAALFLLFPGIDLWASALFYRPADGFFLGHLWPLRAIYAAVPLLTDAVVIAVPVLFLLSLLRGRTIWGLDRKIAAFLLISLALGPGILVNTIFKDHWGRARPAQISEFGGTHTFTPAPLPAHECGRNCSFPAGHPAMGFYLLSFALLIPDARRRRIGEGAAIAAGAAIGVVRMAQGGHFLSDVVFSGIIVCATSWLLYRWIVVADGLGALFRDARPPPWLIRLLLGTIIAALLSIAFIDRPVARFFHDGNPEVHDAFAAITQLGLAEGYLVVSGVLFIGLRISARITESEALARRFRLYAHRALFIFLVAALSGIAADILKVILGRARPKLFFNDGIYGFFWGASHSDHWSMPSGHATTITALAFAFYLLWPRGLPAYIVIALLVAMSRVIIGAHYPSDVFCGVVLGGITTWAIAARFARAGIMLSGHLARPPLPEATLRSLSDSP